MRQNISQEALKSQARELVKEFKQRGQVLVLGHALEQAAKANGFRNWNTAKALLPQRLVPPSPSPSPSPSPLELFRSTLSVGHRVRHHSAIPASDVSDEVLQARHDFHGRARRTSLREAIEHEMHVFSGAPGRSVSTFGPSWATAVDAARVAFDAGGSRDYQISVDLELACELLMPQKMRRLAADIGRSGPAALTLEHFGPVWDFLKPFQSDRPSPSQYGTFLNDMGLFRRWFCNRFGVARHDGKQETWGNIGGRR